MSNIEWTDVTWNPVTGCSRVSEGCRNCYAEAMARRIAGMERTSGVRPQRYLPVVNHVGWNGRIIMHDDRLYEPLRWRKPRRVFVCSMSDLFHEGVASEFVRDVLDVVRRCPQHTFQVLTKRPENILEKTDGIDTHIPNLWIGASVEDQATADARVPVLAQVPAAVRFLSVEPLLGPVDLRPLLLRRSLGHCTGCQELKDEGATHQEETIEHPSRAVHWVIVGGESGRAPRPCHAEWIRPVFDGCYCANVPVFVKQSGSNFWVGGRRQRVYDKKGGRPEYWPTWMRRREWPAGRWNE